MGKGQISDMAFCIVDADPKIAGMAKHFFSELSKKANTLYNVMPDIVSRLSDPEIGIAEDSFRTIMKYIIGLIEKDKLLESLVEKLCHRFRATRTERQWRDIAFCLSLFPYSDRSIKKLSDNFPCWSDKLHEDSVYESICVIFAGVKKGVGVAVGGSGRGEAKQLMEELEAKVEEARAKGVIDHTAEKNAQAAKEGKKKGAGKKGKSIKDGSDSEEEANEDVIDNEDVEEGNQSRQRGKDADAGSGDDEKEDRGKESVKKKDLGKSAKKGKKRAEEDQVDSEDDFQERRSRRRGRN